MDSILCKECKECLFINALQLIIQSSTKYKEMEVTKRLWGKNGGRTYKHFIQSFAKDENISPEQAHQIAYQLAEALPEWADFEVLIATHTDTEYLHTHFIVNSVSYVDGHKLQQSRDELQNMKDQSDHLYREMMVNQ